MQRHQWVLHRWMQQIKLVRVRCLVLQREQQDLLQCPLMIKVGGQSMELISRLGHPMIKLWWILAEVSSETLTVRDPHRQPVREVLRQLRPLVTSSAYHRNQMVMLDQVRVRQRQEDLQARVSVVALQTLRLHQQVMDRAQRMLMAVQETVRLQC